MRVRLSVWVRERIAEGFVEVVSSCWKASKAPLWLRLEIFHCEALDRGLVVLCGHESSSVRILR